jgi:hypothetical protein
VINRVGSAKTRHQRLFAVELEAAQMNFLTIRERGHEAERPDQLNLCRLLNW